MLTLHNLLKDLGLLAREQPVANVRDQQFWRDALELWAVRREVRRDLIYTALSRFIRDPGELPDHELRHRAMLRLGQQATT